MSAVNVSISLDYVERMSEVERHVSGHNGRVSAWIDFDGFSMHGRNAEMFRRLAARCSEAAAILEAANASPVTTEG